MAIVGFTGWAEAQTSVSWLSAVSGTWTDASKWSGSPYAPNSVVIGATGSPYQVLLLTDISIDSIDVASQDARLQVQSSAHLRGTTISGAGSVVFASGATLHGVTLKALAGALPSVLFQGGFTLDGGTLSLGEPDGAGVLEFVESQSVQGNGSIIFTHGGRIKSDTDKTLTLAKGISIVGGVAGADLATGTLNNQGLITSTSLPSQITFNSRWLENSGTVQSGGGRVKVNPFLSDSAFIDLFHLSNTGVIHAAASGEVDIGGITANHGTISTENGTLRLYGNGTNYANIIASNGTIIVSGIWHNNGTINLLNSSLSFDGTMVTADIGNIVRTGGSVDIRGKIDNSGTTLAPTVASGAIRLSGGSISGGTIRSAPGAEFIFNDGTLSNITLAGTIIKDGSIFGHSIINSGTLLNATLDLQSTSETSSLVLLGDLGGSGTITFNGTGEGLFLRSVGAISIGNGVTIRTGTNAGFWNVEQNNSGFINNGTLSAETPAKLFQVSGNRSIASPGVLQAKNGGRLQVSLLTGDVGTILVGSASEVNLLNGAYVLARNTAFNGATLSMGGTWSNAASINVLDGYLQLGGNWTNNGSIALSRSTLDLSGVSSGIGSIVASDSTLTVYGKYNSSQIKTISLNNSRVVIGPTASINNASDFIPLDGTVGRDWQLDGGTISGGSLTGTLFPLQVSSSGTLSGILNEAGVHVLADATLTLAGNWSNNGTITTNGGNVVLRGTPGGIGSISLINGTLDIATKLLLPQALSVSRTSSAMRLAGGELDLGGATFNTNIGDGPFQFFNGTISNGAIVGNELRINNTGRISNSTIHLPITIEPTGTLTLLAPVQNFATLQIDGGTLVLAGSTKTAWLGSVIRNGGTIMLRGTLENDGDTLDLNDFGTFSIQTGTINGGTIVGSPTAPLTIVGSFSSGVATFSQATIAAPVLMANRTTLNFINGATLSGASIESSVGTINFRGTQNLSGTGTIIVPESGGIRALSGSLTISEGITVLNATVGRLGFLDDVIINQGLILTRGSTGNLAAYGTFTNNGTVAVRDGGVFSVPGKLTNYSGGTLSGGTWRVASASTLSTGPNIFTNNASIILDGVGSSFPEIRTLRTNLGRFTVTNGRDFGAVGSLTNSGTIVVGPGSSLSVVDSFNNLSGLLDLNFKMVVDYGGASPLDELVGQIGSQIISSAVIADPGLAIGSVDDGNVVRLQIVANGDANMDGFVNYEDLTTLASNYSGGDAPPGSLVAVPTSLNDPKWVDGDFNYDGAVNLTDLYALGWQYKDQQHPLTQSLQTLGLPTINVPEPGLGAAAIAMLSVLTARRRRR